MLKIVFDLSAFESVEIVPIADVHCGHELFKEHIFKNVVDYVLEEPTDPKCARICLLNGDLTESVTKSTRAGDIFDMTMTPAVQVATMVKYLLPLTETSQKYPMGKILSYCAGNHDEGRYKDTGISAAESIAVGLHLEDRYSVDGCYSFIQLARRQATKEKIRLTLYNTHMTGGGSTIGGKANRVLKAGINGGILADVVVGSHVHQPLTFKEDYILPDKLNLIQKTTTYVVTNSFMSYGGYAQRGGMKPSTIAIPRIIVNQERSWYKGEDLRYLKTEVIL